MNLIFLILVPIAIAISAVTYTFILTRPGHILNGVYNILDVFFKTDERAQEDKGPHPLFMVLIHCHKCVAGQWALWIFFYYNWQNYFFDFTLQIIFQHIFFILYSIISASIIKETYNKHIEQ